MLSALRLRLGLRPSDARTFLLLRRRICIPRASRGLQGMMRRALHLRPFLSSGLHSPANACPSPRCPHAILLVALCPPRTLKSPPADDARGPSLRSWTARRRRGTRPWCRARPRDGARAAGLRPGCSKARSIPHIFSNLPPAHTKTPLVPKPTRKGGEDWGSAVWRAQARSGRCESSGGSLKLPAWRGSDRGRDGGQLQVRAN